jgi:hypothetical protein
MGCNEVGLPHTTNKRVAVLNAVLLVCGSRGIGYTTSKPRQFPVFRGLARNQITCFLKTLKVQKSRTETGIAQRWCLRYPQTHINRTAVNTATRSCTVWGHWGGVSLLQPINGPLGYSFGNFQKNTSS